MTMLGRQRMEALQRLVGLVEMVVAWPAIVLIWLPIAFVVGVLDWVVTLLFDRSLVGPRDAITEPVWWAEKQTEWVLFGGQGPWWLPYASTGR